MLTLGDDMAHMAPGTHIPELLLLIQPQIYVWIGASALRACVQCSRGSLALFGVSGVSEFGITCV